MTDRDGLLNDIRKARFYINDLLGHVDDGDWFRQPSEGVTHIAWQVGHLAVAQYGLALNRLRGERPEDEELIPASFRQQFGKGSVPVPDPAAYPPIEEIRAVFDRVHQQVLDEVGRVSEASLDEPTEGPPHPAFDTKRGALAWCVMHEFIHAGQIALLRRLFGSAPLR